MDDAERPAGMYLEDIDGRWAHLGKGGVTFGRIPQNDEQEPHMDSTEYTYIPNDKYLSSPNITAGSTDNPNGSTVTQAQPPSDTQEWTRLMTQTALQQAQHYARRATLHYRHDWPAAGDEAMQRAAQYAALAQAEALTRMAEVLEQHLDDAAHDGLRRLIQTTFGD